MPDIEWPREIWMAEREEHDQGVVNAVLSEGATIARYAGDLDRDREFHRYVDSDVYDSAEKYYRHQMAALKQEGAAALHMLREIAALQDQMRDDRARVVLPEPERLYALAQRLEAAIEGKA